MTHFEWPWVFALIPLPLLSYFFFPRAKMDDMALRVPNLQRFRLDTSSESSFSKQRHWLRPLLLICAWLAFITAAARPQELGEAISMPTTGRDLLIAVDISGSMATDDMIIQNKKIPRLLIVKHIVGDFLTRRKGDRVGLILFGTNAYLQAPLTFDLKTVEQFLQEATLRIAGEKTAIGDAIGLGVKRLKDRPESQRVMILLTDGENTAGSIQPRQAADLAAQAGIKVYTVGIGANSMQVDNGFFGGTRTVNPSAELDESTLTYIAEKTGGMYFRAHNPEELQEIYLQLDKLEAIAQENDFFQPIQSLYFYPLSIGLLLSFVLALLQFSQIGSRFGVQK